MARMIEEGRRQAELQKSREHMLADVREGDVVVIGKRRYARMDGGMYIEPRGAGAPRVTNVGFGITAAELRNRVLYASSTEAVRLERAGHVQEITAITDDVETAEVRKRFPELLERLYPGVGMTAMVNARKALGLPATPDVGKVLEHIATKSELVQGRSGVCYLFAAFNSLKKARPDLYYATLERSIAYDPQRKAWRVRLLGFTPHIKASLTEQGWISVTDKEVAEWKATLPTCC
jgi:hypothetical protein